jgi:hypothetical protein
VKIYTHFHVSNDSLVSKVNVIPHRDLESETLVLNITSPGKGGHIEWPPKDEDGNRFCIVFASKIVFPPTTGGNVPRLATRSRSRLNKYDKNGVKADLLLETLSVNVKISTITVDFSNKTSASPYIVRDQIDIQNGIGAVNVSHVHVTDFVSGASGVGIVELRSVEAGSSVTIKAGVGAVSAENILSGKDFKAEAAAGSVLVEVCILFLSLVIESVDVNLTVFFFFFFFFAEPFCD